MNLKISELYNKSDIDGTFALSSAMMSHPGTHLFIASNKWDRIDIDINDKLNPEDLRYLHTVCDNIHSYISNTITDKEVQCLCMLYPNLSGSIRMGYMTKHNLSEVTSNIEIRT